MNSRVLYGGGAPDEVLIRGAKDGSMIIVTRDIRMALRSLKHGVGVILVECGDVTYLTAHKHEVEEFKGLYKYLRKRKNE